MIRRILLLLILFYFPFQGYGYSYKYVPFGLFTSVHVLIVNPAKEAVVPVRAEGKIKREPVLVLVKRSGALAGVNGGFWRVNGKPAGILKINGSILGIPGYPRGAIGWSESGATVLIDRVQMREKKVVPLSFQTTQEEWAKMENIVGGAPVLIASGQMIEDYSMEHTLDTFLHKRHGRTAVGIRPNGEWVFVVADPSCLGFLGGMKIRELAEFMRRQGCIKALNLDGGSSSTMVIEGVVVNKPCGKFLLKGERAESVSDAILVMPAR